MYFDKLLSMWLKWGAVIAERVTTAIKYICQILGISIENYLTDLAGADYPENVWKSYQELRNILEFCGQEESVEKAYPPATKKKFFIGVDTEALTLLVTQERLEEIKLLEQNWLKFESATSKQLQSLIGKLNFIFISRLLNWLREIQSKKISNDQELIQSDLTSCPKTKREITKYIDWQQFTKVTRGKPNEQLFPRQVVIHLHKIY